MKKTIVTAILTAVLTATALSASGCGKKHDNDVKYEVAEISKEDADSILESALQGTGCSFSYDEKIPDGDTAYYVYTIEKDGEELEDSIAIESVSGKVYTYDSYADTYSEFSDFSEYNPENDESILWTGEYKGEKFVITIEEEDPGSFAYAVYESMDAIKKGDESLMSGYAYQENNASAISDNEDGKITFDIAGNKVTVTGEDKNSAYSGVYEK